MAANMAELKKLRKIHLFKISYLDTETEYRSPTRVYSGQRVKSAILGKSVYMFDVQMIG